jgi:amidohydrolase
MTDIADLKNRIAERIDGELGDSLIELSRRIHARPETAFEEHQAAGAITAFLTERGASVVAGVGGLPTAFEADWGKAAHGPTVAILAEYDALPVLGHACGHNVIAAAATGAFMALSVAGTLPGTLKLIGTPAEEDGGGKVIMHEGGVFDGADVAMMIHPFDETVPFVEFAGRVPLTVIFHGLSAHAGSMPERGVSALDAAVLFLTGLNALRQRLRDGARFHGVIAEGGTSPAIIPERTRVELYLRAYDQAYLGEMVDLVKACAQGAAAQIGCGVQVESLSKSFDSFICNRPLADAFARNLARLGVPAKAERHRAFAATDFGNVSQSIPSIHPYLGMGEGLVCHTPEFAVASGDARGMRIVKEGAKALAMTALDVFFDPSLMQDIKRDHAARAQGSRRGSAKS